MIRSVLLPLGLALLLGWGGLEPPPAAADDAQGSEDDTEFQRRVGEAIDRGVAYLKAAQRRDGTWSVLRGKNHDSTVGEQALILLALAKSGVPARDDVIQKGLRPLRANLATLLTKPGGGFRFFSGYALSCTILLYDTLHRRERRGRISYPPKVKKEIGKIVTFLVEHQAGNGGWRYPYLQETAEKRGFPVADMSVTQYVLLALNVAARGGIKIPGTTFERALEFVMKAQQPDGPAVELRIDNPNYEEGGDYGPPTIPVPGARARGWGYTNLQRIYGSMTVGGMSSLAILKERLRAADLLPRERVRQMDRAILDGLAWLSHHFDVTKNPAHATWHYYFLYGMERACSLLRLKYVSDHDWYNEGAEHLLEAQVATEDARDGHWPAYAKPGQTVSTYHDPVIQTCFALLFLKRGTEPPSEPVHPAVVTGGD